MGENKVVACLENEVTAIVENDFQEIIQLLGADVFVMAVPNGADMINLQNPGVRNWPELWNKTVRQGQGLFSREIERWKLKFKKK